jgi:sugar/nucleoside kinase (ribokinase family)
MDKDLDCIVCGSCVVDVLVRPVPLETPITGGKLFQTDPLELTTGGIVSNSGITMARLGMRVAAFSYVGDDPWAEVIRHRYEAEGLHADGLLTHPTGATSTTAVLIDPSGERSFMHCVGAPKLLDRSAFLSQLDLFRRSRWMLLGYYPLLPNLLGDLPEVLAALRKEGCQTALDAAGDGGDLEPLLPVLPHLDLYVPSLEEAIHQTGKQDPRSIVATYRDAGAAGIVGVKLGRRGVLLSPQAGEYLEIPVVTPPGAVVDTTGAGDCFLGGLLTGLLRGKSIEEAGRLGCAAGACCVTCLGATTGIRNYEQTVLLAGVG